MSIFTVALAREETIGLNLDYSEGNKTKFLVVIGVLLSQKTEERKAVTLTSIIKNLKLNAGTLQENFFHCS